MNLMKNAPVNPTERIVLFAFEQLPVEGNSNETDFYNLRKMT